MVRTLIELPLLSGCTDGKGIKIAATSSPGTLIHTAHATKTDRIWLSAMNMHSGTVEIQIQWGETTAGTEIRQTLQFRRGVEQIVAGMLLTNSLEVRIYASIADKVFIYGEIERTTAEGL